MEYKKCAGGIVVSKDKDILVITNQIGKHTFPKGTCEKGELAADTARREITEESGLTKLKIVRHLGVLTRRGFTAENAHTPSVIKEIDMFHCTTDQHSLAPFAPDAVDARWIHPHKLSKVLTWTEEVAFFEQHRASLELT